LTQPKKAFIAGAISSYPGAAGPVNGTVAPMVMLFDVTPGVDAALADVDNTLVISNPLMAPAASTRTIWALRLSPNLIRFLITAPLLMMYFIDRDHLA
jgi:hypothetical protein